MANLILIGPQGVGKSSVGAWIAYLTNRKQESLDNRNHQFHATRLTGFAAAEVRNGSFMQRYRSWKPFEIRSVELYLESTDHTVIDFGAGHSVYEDPEQFARLARAVVNHKVVLLLPTTDLERSRTVLLERRPDVDHEFINHLLDHPSNTKLANYIIYRNSKTAKEIALEILDVVPASSNGPW